jgi:hypothetical protein
MMMKTKNNDISIFHNFSPQTMRLNLDRVLVDRSTIEHRPIISLSVVDDARQRDSNLVILYRST